MTTSSDRQREYALEELLYRQNGMFAQIARYVQRAHVKSADFTDFMEYARLAAIQAYQRYNPYEGTKLKTFVYTSVYSQLITIADEITPIKCPSGKRSFRSYFKGGYDGDPDRKEAFEDKWAKQLRDPIKRSEVESQCKFIDSEFVSYDDFITNEDGQVVEQDFEPVFSSKSTEESGIDRMDWLMTVDKLNASQQMIYHMFFEQEQTVSEISAVSGMSEREIKKGIRSVKLHFQRRFPEYQTDRIRKSKRVVVTASQPEKEVRIAIEPIPFKPITEVEVAAIIEKYWRW
jgi:RNA polymerase sigma factor (sigma-70 family)